MIAGVQVWAWTLAIMGNAKLEEWSQYLNYLSDESTSDGANHMKRKVGYNGLETKESADKRHRVG